MSNLPILIFCEWSMGMAGSYIKTKKEKDNSEVLVIVAIFEKSDKMLMPGWFFTVENFRLCK